MKNKPHEMILKRSGFVILLLLILSAVALLRIATTHEDIDEVAKVELPLIEVLTRIETNQLEQSISFERALRYAEEFDKNKYAIDNFNVADSSFYYLSRLVDQDLQEASNHVAEALENVDQETQQIKLKGLLLSVQKLGSDHKSYERHVEEVLELLRTERIEEALIRSEKVEDEENQFNKQIEGVLMRHEMFTEALVQIVEQEEVMSMKWVVILTLVFVVIAMASVFTFSYYVWKPLDDIRRGAVLLGDGDLDTRVKLSNTSITEDVVDAFNSMAEKLKESKKQIDGFIHFSYSSAHDLKAPVNNLKSLLDLLEKEKQGGDNYNIILRNFRRSIDQLSISIDSLNNINHLRERLTDEFETLKFDDIFDIVEANITEQMRVSKATIKSDFLECAEVNYPKGHLISVFQNLLMNSINYRNPQKPLQIELKTKEKNGKVHFMIRDNGLGFESYKHKDEIVKPFIRLHSHVEGSGLGMYIIKTIVDHHNGSLEIQSKPNIGTQINIILN